MEIINAKIKASYLGVDEEGTLYLQIIFDSKNGTQYSTDRVAFVDASFIKDIVNTLEIRSWEELPRKFARIKIEGKRVLAIGNLIEDKWIGVR